MTSVLPKDAAALKAIAQELAGQDADYIEQFLRELLADPVRIASPQSARRNAAPQRPQQEPSRRQPDAARCLAR